MCKVMVAAHCGLNSGLVAAKRLISPARSR
jgi:hypothetical protein